MQPSLRANDPLTESDAVNNPELSPEPAKPKPSLNKPDKKKKSKKDKKKEAKEKALEDKLLKKSMRQSLNPQKTEELQFQKKLQLAIQKKRKQVADERELAKELKERDVINNQIQRLVNSKNRCEGNKN